jgi:hypothetical protein
MKNVSRFIDVTLFSPVLFFSFQYNIIFELIIFNEQQYSWAKFCIKGLNEISSALSVFSCQMKPTPRKPTCCKAIPIWHMDLSSLEHQQALSACEFHVEYKSKSNVWEVRDFNTKFPINMKCLWHVDSIVWRHGWSILNSSARNASIQRGAEL